MKYRVFYSRDCMMYGVQALKRNVNYTGDPARWVQVLPPAGKGARRGKSAYTYYEGVAKRWLKEFEARERLEQIRRELRRERISYGELAELADLKQYIASGDYELQEAAGVPESEAW